MSLRRVAMLVRLDLLHMLRRPIFWFWVAIIVFVTWGLSSGNARISSGSSDVGGTEAWLTSEFAIAQQLSLLVTVLYAFFVTIVAGMVIIRDDEQHVGELLHSTPLRPGEYVWGRFLGVLVICFAVLAIHLLCMIVVYQLLPRSSMDAMRGPLQAMNYVRPALIFGVPTIVFVAGASFAIGTLTRKPIIVFFLPVALILACGFFLWGWKPTWLDPRIDRALMFVDPSGFRWLEGTWLDVDRGVDFYNKTPMGFDALIIGSRLMLVAIGLGAVGLVQRRFVRDLRGAKHGVATGRGELTVPPSDEGAIAGHVEPVAALRMRSHAPGFIRGALDVARVELRELRHHPGLYLFAPLILIEVIATMFFAVGAFDTPLLQTPGTLAVGTMNTLTLLVCLLIQFYSVESVQRERTTNAGAILYASPVRSGSLLLGKAVANTAVGGVILLSALLACLIVLLIQGRVPFSLRPFLLIWGLILIPTFLLWSAFVMAAAALLRNRYTTHALCLGVLIYTGYKQQMGEMNWVGNWDAWSVVTWSDMGPLEFNRPALLLNRLLVLSLAALFIALTVRVFTRRDFDTARVVQRLRPLALLGHGLRLSPFILAPLVIGSLLYVKVLNGFQGDRADEMQKDYWRRNVATWTDTKVPAIETVDMSLELDPPRRWLASEGTYRIVNPHEETLGAIALTGGLHWRDLEWTMNGEPYEPDDCSHLYVFTPPARLQKGDSVEIGWRFNGFYPDGITENGGGNDEFILEAGVVLTSFTTSFVPVVGYLEEVGVDEDNEYDSREFADDFYEGVTEPLFGAAWPHTVRIAVSGPAEYTYNSVGVLVSDDIQGGVRTVVWETDRPVTFFNVVAGKWDVKRGDGTAIYYHPEHTYNIEEMSRALDDARKWYSEWFHPYPWQELKLSEFPALATYAQGFSTNITFSEAIGFLTRSDPRTSTAYAITAHEAAHQWWGGILGPGEGPGGNILAEGMAHFSTILLIGQGKGLRERIEFCKRIEESYGDARVVDSERAMVRTDGTRTGDTTVQYDKGGWVFWMLLNLMGEEAALAGIREFIAHYSTDPDHPVLQDFIATMRPHAPDPGAFDDFVDQWFFDVVVPEYRLSDAGVEALDDGWIVTATIENVGAGRMPVEVAAVLDERFADDGAPGPDYRDARARVTLGAGERTAVRIVCDFEPGRIVVDPDAMVLQLEREKAVTRF